MSTEIKPAEPQPKKRRGRPLKQPATGDNSQQRTAAPPQPAPEPQEPQELEVPLTRETFPSYVEQTLMLNAPQLLRSMYPALEQLVKDKNVKALEMTLQLFGLVKQGGGVNLVTNIANIGMGGLPSDGDRGPRSFEGIVRVLEQKEAVDRLGLGPGGPPVPDFGPRVRTIEIEAEE